MEDVTGVYVHLKSGKRYEVLGMARHSETLEELIVYKALYVDSEFGEGAIWVIPKSMFFEEVEVDGKKVPRFRKVEE